MLSSFAPVVATHNPAVLSRDPVMTNRPSGVKRAQDNAVMGKGLNEILLVDVANPCDLIAIFGHSQLASG